MTPKSVRVTGWGMYAPERRLTNADLERVVDTSDEWIVQRTGIRERRVAAAHETTATLSAIAGKRAIAVAGPAARRHRRHPRRDADARLLDALDRRAGQGGDRQSARRGDGRHGRVLGLRLRLLGGRRLPPLGSVQERAGNRCRDAHPLPRLLRSRRRASCSATVPGAVVLSASEEEGGGMQGLEMTTDPDGAYMIWLPSGGSRSPVSGGTLARGEHYVRMEGRETYRYATKTMATTALKAIERAGWKPDEIDLFIPHQANVRIIESVAKGLDLPMDKMFVNVDRYGNTSAASVPIALAEAVDSGRIKIGDKVVLVAFGAGLTSGGIALEWTADPTCGQRALTVEPDGERARARRVGFGRPDPRSPAPGPRGSRAASAARRCRPGRARARPPRGARLRPQLYCCGNMPWKC